MIAKSRADQRKFHIIYKTTCTVTERWYVGLHSTDDINDGYRGSGTRLQYSLKKYGKDQHSFEILEYLPTRKALVNREAELITEEMIKNPMCMNLMKGGGREIHANILKEQSRAKISAVAKEMWARRKADPVKMAEHTAKLNTAEHVAKRASAIKAKGHKRTPEQIASMKQGQKVHYDSQTPEQKLLRQRKGTWGRTKTFKIEDTTGAVQLVTNLQEFSLKNGIKGTALYKTESRKNFANGFRIVGRADEAL